MMQNPFSLLRDFLLLREAVIKADCAHIANGNRYYVLPANDGKLIVMDRPNFRKLKHKGYITHKARIRDLEAECFYCTPYRNGNGILPPNFRKAKTKAYMQWRKNIRKGMRKKATSNHPA